ncbi:MAG: DUF924 family protein [Hyphomicrobiales bacterium]
MSPDRVLKFWFEDHTSADWFGGKSEFDDAVRAEFADLLASARQSELFAWRLTPKGRLAEIIVLDQFSRQLFRNDALAFSSDPLALALAQEAVAQGDDDVLTVGERQFLYMPYMHSESLTVQNESVKVFVKLDDLNALEYAHKHRAVIEQFGRYPMRNKALNRTSTQQEIDYIAERGGSMF